MKTVSGTQPDGSNDTNHLLGQCKFEFLKNDLPVMRKYNTIVGCETVNAKTLGSTAIELNSKYNYSILMIFMVFCEQQ